jgi:hypothetical protein
MNASDVLIETLLDWGVGSVFGLQVRNEESALLNVAPAPLLFRSAGTLPAVTGAARSRYFLGSSF